ncbi:LysR family transcriptional regulator [Ramlibacter rhizophilus]|uniref:LysR family transcriptional regulator n=1 Tax=Ramlibacter rhizophilus TaxID=1781167 RepID=A0A4Z0BHF2_9BURK|nr:LysR family transcriptional regulator [Ramlibacter rhizophilus]TFY97544.1 LysR family transcriptional regulator [Ramlibacter rhizophilus]
MNARDIRSLDVGMLRTFDALMRERSVSRAAQRLFLSQPAVSASLTRLREVFGDPLFTRMPHGVAPTARAEALAPQVEQLLAGMARLLEPQQDFDPATSNRIFRVAGSDFASRWLLAPLSRELVEAGSAIRILWEPTQTGSIAERLRKGEIDLAVIARIHRPQDMQTEVLYEDHYVYVTRRDHPQAGEPVTLESFCAVPQVFLGYGTSTLDDLIDEELARRGMRRHAQLAVSSFGQILHQLRCSDHAAVLGRRVAQAFASELAIRALPLELPRYQSMVCWDGGSSGDVGVEWLRGGVVGISVSGALA